MDKTANYLLQSEGLEGDATMLERAQRRRIRRLYEDGISISQIAVDEGINRKTVYRIISEDPDQMPATAAKPKLLDDYAPLLAGWIAKGLSAAWMHRQLRDKHQFDGSYETVKGYVTPHRVRPPKEATVRFETGPAEQAQCDWMVIHYPDANGIKRKAYCFSMILAYSRFIYAVLTLHANQKTLVECHERAFRAFGGIPHEILYDRQSPVYTRQKGKEIILNPVFADYARSRHFEPALCKARRGQTKGKVERPYRYIRQDFLLPNNDADYDTLQTLLPIWLDTQANVRIHRTTRERPSDRLASEQFSLQPLVMEFFAGDWSVSRRVSRESLVSYLGSRYSVPWQHIDHPVQIGDEAGTVNVRCEGRIIARHELSTQRGEIHRNPVHYEGLSHPVRQTTWGVKKEFRERFPGSSVFLDGVERHRIGNVRYHLREVLALTSLYGESVVAEAILQSGLAGDFSCGAVKRLCERGSVDGPAACPPPEKIRYGPRSNQGAVEQRSLQFYDELASQEGGCVQ